MNFIKSNWLIILFILLIVGLSIGIFLSDDEVIEVEGNEDDFSFNDVGMSPTIPNGASTSGSNGTAVNNIGNLVSELNKNIKASSFLNMEDTCATYKKCLNLSDNEFKALATAYKTAYGSKLSDDISDAYGCTYVGTDNKDLMLARLNTLNVARAIQRRLV